LEAIKTHLNISQISKPAEGALQGALIAELTRAQENIRFSVQQRTQAIYYLLGLMGAAAALIANTVNANNFTTALNARSGTRFITLTLAAQFLLWIVSLFAAVVYGVAFKANDGVRFHNRKIRRLNDVLYGYPNGTDTANPGWVAVLDTEHDTRDREDVFSESKVSEWLALAVYFLALVALIVFTIMLQKLGAGFFSLTACIVGEFYTLILLALGGLWIYPLLKSNARISKYDGDVMKEYSRAKDRLRKDLPGQLLVGE
jgi:hypothetical protein